MSPAPPYARRSNYKNNLRGGNSGGFRGYVSKSTAPCGFTTKTRTTHANCAQIFFSGNAAFNTAAHASGNRFNSSRNQKRSHRKTQIFELIVPEPFLKELLVASLQQLESFAFLGILRLLPILTLLGFVSVVFAVHCVGRSRPDPHDVTPTTPWQ